MRPSTAVTIVLAFATFVGTGAPRAQEADRRFDDLVAAYPGALERHDGKQLFWRDGTAMPLADGNDDKTFAQRLRQPSLADQLRLPYRRGPLAEVPAVNNDPGRFRNAAFFEKMYGNCRTGDVARRLVSVIWLPRSWGKTIRVTSVNGVDRRLQAISAEIDALPAAIKRAAYPIAGSYKCRAVADTGRPSAHGYGIAIDLNLDYSQYWFWRRSRQADRMPIEIVEIFEKHGFIWGGKWYHFDTMHFEYRPELLSSAAAK